MKLLTFFSALIATAGLGSAQSNPSWWKYAPPEASAIVGIQWKTLQKTLFAPIIAAELAPGGSFGFPDIEMLRTPEQMIIGSPSTLAVEYGNFPIAKLRTQATEKGLKRTTFKAVELFVSSDPAVLSVAYINDKLLLVGSQKNIEDSINRIANPKDHAYSPLLARAARYSKEDIWVVASRLPDPLASQFLPLEIEATAFEGSISQWDGLHLVAAVERSTPMKALDFADSLAESLASRPAMSEGTEISTRDRSVLIRMDLDEEQLASSLRMPAPVLLSQDPHEQVLAIAAAPAKPQPRAFVPPTAPVAAKVPQPSASLEATIHEVAVNESTLAGATTQVALPPAPPRPKTIKIMGLDSGPKEIPLGQH
ncbi:MAG: hypothetical protein ABIR70_20165 [Bryobacteraceae bacterium]